VLAVSCHTELFARPGLKPVLFHELPHTLFPNIEALVCLESV
jgi:hypothetical protein